MNLKLSNPLKPTYFTSQNKSGSKMMQLLCHIYRQNFSPLCFGHSDFNLLTCKLWLTAILKSPVTFILARESDPSVLISFCSSKTIVRLSSHYSMSQEADLSRLYPQVSDWFQPMGCINRDWKTKIGLYFLSTPSLSGYYSGLTSLNSIFGHYPLQDSPSSTSRAFTKFW